MDEKKKSGPPAPSLRQPVQKLLPGKLFVESTELAIEARKLNEIAQFLWLSDQGNRVWDLT